MKCVNVSMVGIAEPQAGRGINKLLADYSKVDGNPQVKYQYFPSEQYVALLSTALAALLILLTALVLSTLILVHLHLLHTG